MKFIRRFSHLCVVDSCDSSRVWVQNKSSEVILTESLKQLSWGPACSYPGSNRGSLNHLCLIFTHGTREEGHFGYKCSLRGNQRVLDPSCLLCPSNGRTRVEEFASPK